MLTGDNVQNTGTSGNKVENPPLKQLLSSEEWISYFHNLSKITGFAISIYDENGTSLLTVEENPICKLVNSSMRSDRECPSSCNRMMLESLILNKPTTYKCHSKIINFSVPVNFINEKAVIVGRNGFVSYEDFLDFLKSSKDNGSQKIPIAAPLNFTDENHIKNISRYIHGATHHLLNNLQEKYKLSEKIGRLTALVDTTILEKLSKNTELIYRYFIDTAEFILGSTSIAVMALDHQDSTYKTMDSAGKHKDVLLNLQFDSKNTIIQQIAALKTQRSPVKVNAEKIITVNGLEKIQFLYLFPVFIAGIMERLIIIFDRDIPQEDLRIINAIRDYIEVTIENHALQHKIVEKMNEVLTSVSEMSKSIAPVLNWERLLQTILEKSIQLIKAEQGSLMLLNHESSELLIKAQKSSHSITTENTRLRPGHGIAGKVLESGVPLLVKDVEKDPRINHKNRPQYKTKSFVSIPLKIEDRLSGVLNIADKATGEAFNETDLKLLQSFAANAEIAIERSLLYKKTKELQKLSITDPLTGILNRRYLNNRLSEEIARYSRYRQCFSFLMVDIDGFKEYNDTYGHLTGDNILKTLATTLANSLRPTDITARFGGDEFVSILPQTPKADAIVIAKRLRENIEKARIPAPEESPCDKFTVSIGLTTYPDDASSVTELLEKTDQALYLAKKGGKNKLVYL